jgi:hypothetical protein
VTSLIAGSHVYNPNVERNIIDTKVCLKKGNLHEPDGEKACHSFNLIKSMTL